MKLKLIMSILVLWLGCSSLWAAIAPVLVGGNPNEQCFQQPWVHNPVSNVSFPFNVTQGNMLIISIGQGCDRTLSPQHCFAPTVTDTLGNAFEEQDGFDPSGLVAVFIFYTCANVGSGPDTIKVQSNDTGPNPSAFPLHEWLIHIKEYTGNVNASINACQDSPNTPPGGVQCESTGGNGVSSESTANLPNGQIPPNFRTTTNIYIYAFQYDRASNHDWTYVGTPNPADYTHKLQYPSVLNSQNIGQSSITNGSLIANIAAPAPPYFWTFSFTGGLGSSPYMANCILAFDSVANQFQATAKKKGLLF